MNESVSNVLTGKEPRARIIDESTNQFVTIYNAIKLKFSNNTTVEAQFGLVSGMVRS